MLRVSAALMAAAATCATLVLAIELIGMLFLPDEASIGNEALGYLLWRPFIFALALAHAITLGLPVFLLLNRRGLTHWWVSLLGGFVVGALPYSLLWLPWRPPPPDLVAAHVIAPFSWLRYPWWSVCLGLFGVVGSLRRG